MGSKQAVLDALDMRDYYAGEISKLKINGTNKGQGLCPFHADTKPSLSVNFNTGTFQCYGCDKHGSIFDFYMEKHGVDFKTALDALAYEAGVDMADSKGIFEREHNYRDPSGQIIYQKRIYKKPNGDKYGILFGQNGNGFTKGLNGTKQTLYNLHIIKKAQSVFLCESEKDCDNLNALGFASTTSGGASSWKNEYAELLKGKRICCLPHNDTPGKQYMDAVCNSLSGLAELIRVMDAGIFGNFKGADISDFIERLRGEGKDSEGIKKVLKTLAKKAPEWKVPAIPASVVKEALSDVDPDAGIITLDTLTPESVEWLWEGHLPYGKLSLFDGDPGLGKSHVALDLISRVTAGHPMPDGTHTEQGGAVLLTAEDGLADTVVPRLLTAGADLSRVATLKFVLDTDGNPRFPTLADIERIETACHKVKARIVVIDPLMAHLQRDTNSFRDQDIRQALVPLTAMADRLKVVVVVIRHLNKSAGTQAIYRGGGSIGIIGACRCAYLIARDPENEDRRIFAGIKNNLAPMPNSLSFAIEGVSGSSQVVWGGVSGHSADALLSIPASPDERSALDEAKAFLEDVLFTGELEAREVQKQARSAGIAEATLRRARKALGVVVKKQGYQGAWVWELPSKDAQDSPKMFIKKNEHLCTSLSTFEGKGPEGGDTQEAPGTTVDVSNQTAKGGNGKADCDICPASDGCGRMLSPAMCEMRRGPANA